MTDKLDRALERLNAILPLKQRQESCSEEVKALHRKMLRSFVERGRILTRDEMAQEVNDLEAAVEVLKSQDMVVFDTQGQAVGAYPFTMEEREHRVNVNGHRVYAMCALDALSVSPMFALPTRIDSRCRVSGDSLCIHQSGHTIENSGEAGDIHFGIIWGAASTDVCCADSLCTEMLFLKSAQVARQWLAEDPDHREIFDLQDAIRFGSRFFVPLLA